MYSFLLRVPIKLSLQTPRLGTAVLLLEDGRLNHQVVGAADGTAVAQVDAEE